MGAVYLAEHQLIGRKAAIKVLLPELSHNAELVNRFFNEARSTATIQHPNLVDVFDFGYLEDGSAYLAMEYLEGETLAQRLDRDGALTLPLIWSIGRQIASAVQAAHEQGIVHRDLKPDNVFLLPDPDQPHGLRVKVLDFGIAKLTGDAVSATGAKTRTGAVMGTPTYMSPEQCRGAGQVDQRSDVYSLGCILYEMACGQPPFVREGLGELIAAHMLEPPPLPSELDPTLSPPLEGLILEMLSKEADARPQTMERVREALDQLVTIPPMTTPALGTPRPTPVGGTTETPTTLAGEVPSEPPRGKGLRVGLGVLAVLALAAVGLLWLRPWSAPKASDHDAGHATASPPPREAHRAPPARDVAARATPRPRSVVRLRVTSEPSGAEVYRAADGLLVGHTPYVQKAAAAQGQAVFLVKLPGHRNRRVLLPADRDGEAHVRLTPLSRPRQARAAPRRRARPRPTQPAMRQAAMRQAAMRQAAMRPIRDGVADPFAQ